MTAAGRRPRRVAITLTDSERDRLADLARRAREPEATTAARLVRDGLINTGAALDAAVRGRAVPRRRSGDRDSGATLWLPPAGQAAAIEELRVSFPFSLRHLRAEHLDISEVAAAAAALAAWRDEINSEHEDPRMVLAFVHELRGFSHWLGELRLDRRPSRLEGR